MPSGEPRPEKVAVVDDVRSRLSSADAALLTEYRGLTVADLARLRQAVREAGGEYKIYKNTLVRLAVRDLGLNELEALLEGPTAIAFVSGDAVLVAKSLREFSRGNPNLVVKGGVLGTTMLSPSDASALADVASREVLLAQLAGAFVAPLRQLAGVLQALPRSLAYGLAALLDQQGGPPADAAPAAEPEAPEPEAAEAADTSVTDDAEETDTAATAEPAAAESAEAPVTEAAGTETAEPAAAESAGAPDADGAAGTETVEPAIEPSTADAPVTDEASGTEIAEPTTAEPDSAEASAPAEPPAETETQETPNMTAGPDTTDMTEGTDTPDKEAQ